MKFAFKTLGCKMNWLDSARITAGLQSAGHIFVDDEESADIVFINSCTVTARADRQSRQEAFKAERIAGQVAVFGCGVRVDGEKWKTNFSNALLFLGEKEIFEHFGVEADEIPSPISDRTRIPIAIQTGCDNACTFCITRIARGRTESFPLSNILFQINRAAHSGAKEIILTGIQLASWGCDDSLKNPQDSRLPELLQEILEKTEIPRIRLSSLGPQFLTPAFFEVFKNPRICDHLHLSVQSGSPEILKKMNRGHGREEILEIAKNARFVRPDTAFTADIIVGFPGETEENFLETLDLVQKVGFSHLHVFPFSPRSGTGAANFPHQISADTKKERALHLRTLGSVLAKDFAQKMEGKTVEVLTELGGSGLSTNYLRLRVPDAKRNEIIKVVVRTEDILPHSGD
ncbi:MAG: MiaB/RimO family radical SAM methylthiotransferase [Candidatus Peregrinibacteria bacterium]